MPGRVWNTPGQAYRGEAVLLAKHCFAPPNGCPRMDTLGLRVAGTA